MKGKAHFQPENISLQLFSGHFVTFVGLLWFNTAFFPLQCQVILETLVCQASQALKEMKAYRAYPALLVPLDYRLYQVKQTHPPAAQICPLSTLALSTSPAIPLVWDQVNQSQRKVRASQ